MSDCAKLLHLFGSLEPENRKYRSEKFIVRGEILGDRSDRKVGG